MPGVGNFSKAVQNLESFRNEILDTVNSGIPLLGICLGLQILFAESEEGVGKGLSLIKGRVVRLPRNVKNPHMGWNTLHFVKQNELFEDVEEGSFVYFVHSYYPVVLDEEAVVAETTYGVTFASVISRKNVYGTQFHPEKSEKVGYTILKNFAKIIKR